MMRRRRLVSYVPGNKGKERVGALCVSVSLKLFRFVVVRKGEEQQLAVQYFHKVSQKSVFLSVIRVLFFSGSIAMR